MNRKIDIDSLKRIATDINDIHASTQNNVKTKDYTKWLSVGIPAALVLLVIIFAYAYTQKTNLDFFSSCEISFTGANGQGSVVGVCDVPSGDYSVRSELLDKAFFTTENDGMLSNDQTVTVRVNYDQVLAESEGIKVKSTEKEYTVSGLIDQEDDYQSYSEIDPSERDSLANWVRDNIEPWIEEGTGADVMNVKEIGFYYVKPYISGDGTPHSGDIYMIYQADRDTGRNGSGDIYETEYFIYSAEDYSTEGESNAELSVMSNFLSSSYDCYTSSNTILNLFENEVKSYNCELEIINKAGTDDEGISENRNMNETYYASTVVNIRDNPSTSASIVGQLQEDQEVSIVASRILSNDEKWGQLDNGNWVCISQGNDYYMIWRI